MAENTSNLDLRIQQIVNEIITDVTQEHNETSTEDHIQLDKASIVQTLDYIETVLFPAHFGREGISNFAVRYELGGIIERIYSTLINQITPALRYHPDFAKICEAKRKDKAKSLTEQFIDKLSTIREYMKTDLQAAYDGDPAAYNFDEIIYSYPGFYAIFVNRVAHELYLLDIPLIPRIMSEHAHSLTGIDIHPGATIGKYFFIDHGTGVVIGETTIIGEHVKIYQGVTLGGLSTRAGQALKGTKRHPTIEDTVTIYSNASILGGDTVIGEDSVIGGSCFITSSVGAHMRVSNAGDNLTMRPSKAAISDMSEYWDYVI